MAEQENAPTLLSEHHAGDALAIKASGSQIDVSTTTAFGGQVPVLTSPAEEKELSTFFKIGIAINLVMLALYFIWAAGQWRRTKK